jgi:hypothetical protein
MNIAVDGKKPPRLSGSVTAAGAPSSASAPNADPALIEEFIALAQRS